VDYGWERDIHIRISMRGYMFRLFNGAISWMQKRKVVVSFSTIEEKYMETTHACKEAIWIMKPCS
jgi:hypothetical protein